MPVEPTLWGARTLINQVVSGDQHRSAVTELGDGKWVVAWINTPDPATSAATPSLKFRIFDALGNPLTGDIEVASLLDIDMPSLTTLANGNFALGYVVNNPGFAQDVYLSIYTPTGTAVASNQAVEGSAGATFAPDVGALNDGGFVYAFDNDDAGHLSMVGVGATGTYHWLTHFAAANYFENDIVGLDNSTFVIASDYEVGGNRDVYFGIYSNGGTEIVPQTRVNFESAAIESHPSVAKLAGGGFAIAYIHEGSPAVWSVYVKMYDVNGSPTSGDILVGGTSRVVIPMNPAVTGLADGSFAVTWAGTFGATDNTEIYTQLFDSLGGVIGDPVRVNGSWTAGDQQLGGVAPLDDGRYVVTFYDTSNGTGAYPYDTFAQIIDPRTTTINGTAGHDVITGHTFGQPLSQWNDTIHGLAFNDVIYGGFGDDILHGDSGYDTLHGGPGADQLYGGVDDDTLYADGEDTVIDGGPGFDVVIAEGTGGLNLNLATSRVERAIGGSGNDVLDASTLASGLSVYLVYLEGGSNSDTLIGSSDDDTLRGGSEADILRGGDGWDTLYVDSADTVIDGGNGFDTVYVEGTVGLNLNLATSRVERVFGGSGDDVLDASASTVHVILDGGAGNDTLLGGASGDTIWYDAGDNPANVRGGGNIAGLDVLVFAGFAAPTSFGLAAHEFELAMGITKDTGNSYPWSEIQQRYNTSWQMITEMVLDDAPHGTTFKFTTFDPTGSLGLQHHYSDYYVFNVLRAQESYNDAAGGGSYLARTTIFYDTPPLAVGPVNYIDDFNTSGQRTSQEYFRLDGTRQQTTVWDVTGSLGVIDYYQDFFNAAGVRTAQTAYFDGRGNGAGAGVTIGGHAGVDYQTTIWSDATFVHGTQQGFDLGNPSVALYTFVF